MRKAKNVNAPNLAGWIIAAAAGLVAFGVLVLVGKFDLFPAAALGGGVAVAVGLILGMPWGGSARAAAAPAQTVAAAAAAPAVVVSAPVAQAEKPKASVAKAVSGKAASAKAGVAKAGVAKAGVAKDGAAGAAKAASGKAAAVKAATKSDGPLRLKAPRKGKADDLKQIEGIGPALEKLVNDLGFYHFEQIASWTDEDVALIDAEMKNFKGRISRDRWVAQAKLIVNEGLEAFRERAKTNNY